MSAPTFFEASRGTLDVIEAIYSRRAVRAYQPGVLDEHRLRVLLEAAVHAPTAMHQEGLAVRRHTGSSDSRASLGAGEGDGCDRRASRQPAQAARSPRGDGIPSPLADPEFNISMTPARSWSSVRSRRTTPSRCWTAGSRHTT